jgi:hypothetical protein
VCSSCRTSQSRAAWRACTSSRPFIATPLIQRVHSPFRIGSRFTACAVYTRYSRLLLPSFSTDRAPGRSCRGSCRQAPRPLASTCVGLTHRFATTSAVSQPKQPLSAAASRPELVCQPVCTLPIGLPTLSRVPWRTGTWQRVWPLAPAPGGRPDRCAPAVSVPSYPQYRPVQTTARSLFALKLSGCAGGATSGLPTESQGRRAAGARAPAGTAVIAATCGPHPPFRRHASRFAAEPAAIRRRQPPRARLPARLHPTDRPAESQPRTLAHRHVAVRRVVLARVVALAVSPCCFCAPLALGSEPQLLFGPFPQSQTR